MTDTLPTNNTDPRICRQCRGRCCQGHAGIWVDPRRFLTIFGLPLPASPADLRMQIAGSHLELREIDGVPLPAPQQTDDGCMFLGDHGCRLSPAQRPCQCLALTPVLETLLDDTIHCTLPAAGSTLTALRNWRRFWDER
ncbi:MAG: hypothetical protein RQ723_01685 [Desulfuromonadales bacterium]|nr:hypothetical protein [Desulfuromonadales bacterium]